MHGNIVWHFACVTVFFDGRGFAEHQTSRSCSVSEIAHKSWITWYIWIKCCSLVYFNIVQPVVCKTVTRQLGWFKKVENYQKSHNLSQIQMQIVIINTNNISKTWYQTFALLTGVHISLFESVCPPSLLLHRILINRRTPRVMHITVNWFIVYFCFY